MQTTDAVQHHPAFLAAGRARWIFWSLIIIATLLLAIGCRPRPRSQPPAPMVGVLVPLSGPAAGTGEALLNGIQLGLGALENDTAIRTDIDPMDSLGTPEGAVAALELLVDNTGIAIVIGAIRPSIVEAVAARAAELGVTLLTPIPPGPRDGSGGAYHLRPGADHDQRFLDALFASRPDLERVALLRVDDRASGETAHALVRAAIERAGRELVTPEVPADAGPTLSLVALAKAQPDAVILVGAFDQLAAFRRPAAELELALLAFTTDADPALFRLPRASDTAAYRRAPAISEPILAALVAEYNEAHGEAPDAWAAYGYDLIRVADHALRHHDGSADGIVKALAATTRFPGVTGLLTFSAERQAHRVLRLVATAGDGPPPYPLLPVWVLGSIPLPVPEPVAGTPADPAPDVTAPAPTIETTEDETTAPPDIPVPTGLAGAVIAIVDFTEPAGTRAQSLADALKPHVTRVIMAAPSSIASVSTLATAHLYRRDGSDEAGAVAVRIAEITGLATTQHPDTRTGLDAVRRIVETYPDAGYFLIVN